MIKFAIAFLLAVFLLGSTPIQTQAEICPGVSTRVHPIAGYEQLTISTTVVNLTVPRGAELAVITVEDQPIRYRDDGTAVTASVGTLIKADGSILVCASAMDRIGFIRDGATDSTINVNYYGRS